MAWVVKLEDGSTSDPFETHADAELFVKDLEAQETRTPEEIWDATTRPRVPRETFLRRVAMGWSAHRALHTSLSGQYVGLARSAVAHLDELMGGRNAELHTVEGRRRTIAQWAHSCHYSEASLRSGVTRYGSLAAYFEHTGWHPAKPPRPDEMTDDKW